MLVKGLRRTFCIIKDQKNTHDDLMEAMIKASLLHVNKFGWNQKAI